MMGHHSWTVESKTVTVRPGTPFDPDYPELGEDSGERYRYVCSCGHHGPWRKDGNLADGDNHLWAAHGLGE